MFLVTLAILLTFAGSLMTGYHVTHNKLEENALQMHEAYAKKFADTTDLIFRAMQHYLKSKSAEIGQHIDKPSYRESMLETSGYNHFFNSVVFADTNNIIVATQPELGVVGKKTVLSEMNYNPRKPFITKPYRAVTGRLIITLSEPVYDGGGNFRGMVAGTIYLEESNMLNDIVSEHFFSDQSYAWVIDKEGHLIYHPDASRNGENVTKSIIAQRLMRGESGHAHVTNLRGIEMLVGYAPVPSSGWGVASQTPVSEIDAPVREVSQRMFYYTAPLVLIMLLLSLILTHKLVVPLKKLALYSRSLTRERIEKNVLERIPSWYFESEQLKKAIQLYTDSLSKEVDYFRREALTDELTGLANRRHIDVVLQEWMDRKRPFCLVLLDIDHFKSFNDAFGHQAGDEVLKGLAEIFRQKTRADDLCGRYGGEEFILLLPDTSLSHAAAIVERIHSALSAKPVYANNFITISAGVGHYPDSSAELGALMSLTDQALYQAKREGRNRTVLV